MKPLSTRLFATLLAGLLLVDPALANLSVAGPSRRVCQNWTTSQAMMLSMGSETGGRTLIRWVQLLGVALAAVVGLPPIATAQFDNPGQTPPSPESILRLVALTELLIESMRDRTGIRFETIYEALNAVDPNAAQQLTSLIGETESLETKNRIAGICVGALMRFNRLITYSVTDVDTVIEDGVIDPKSTSKIAYLGREISLSHIDWKRFVHSLSVVIDGHIFVDSIRSRSNAGQFFPVLRDGLFPDYEFKSAVRASLNKLGLSQQEYAELCGYQRQRAIAIENAKDHLFGHLLTGIPSKSISLSDLAHFILKPKSSIRNLLHSERIAAQNKTLTLSVAVLRYANELGGIVAEMENVLKTAQSPRDFEKAYFVGLDYLLEQEIRQMNFSTKDVDSLTNGTAAHFLFSGIVDELGQGPITYSQIVQILNKPGEIPVQKLLGILKNVYRRDFYDEAERRELIASKIPTPRPPSRLADMTFTHLGGDPGPVDNMRSRHDPETDLRRHLDGRHPLLPGSGGPLAHASPSIPKDHVLKQNNEPDRLKPEETVAMLPPTPPEIFGVEVHLPHNYGGTFEIIAEAGIQVTRALVVKYPEIQLPISPSVLRLLPDVHSTLSSIGTLTPETIGHLLGEPTTMLRHIILTGANMHGCHLEAFESLVRYLLNKPGERLAIHIVNTLAGLDLMGWLVPMSRDFVDLERNVPLAANGNEKAIEEVVRLSYVGDAMLDLGVIPTLYMNGVHRPIAFAFAWWHSAFNGNNPKTADPSLELHYWRSLYDLAQYLSKPIHVNDLQRNQRSLPSAA